MPPHAAVWHELWRYLNVPRAFSSCAGHARPPFASCARLDVRGRRRLRSEMQPSSSTRALSSHGHLCDSGAKSPRPTLRAAPGRDVGSDKLVHPPHLHPR